MSEHSLESHGRAKTLPHAIPHQGGPQFPHAATVSTLKPAFLDHCALELRFARRTIELYSQYLDRIVRILGDVRPEEITRADIVRIKASVQVGGRGLRQARNILAGLRTFFRYCRETRGITTLAPEEVRRPRVPRREVEFLTAEEIDQFVAAIPFEVTGPFRLRWLMFRAFVETLLGTGLRIAEATALLRSGVDLVERQAMIVGKGGKQRTVFFSRRAVGWLKEYLNRRDDGIDRLFLLHPSLRPVHPIHIQKLFIEVRKRAGIEKRVTAHILRHTVATHLVLNGCPLSHVKQVLGHERLTTTCRHYVGVDKRAAKAAHLRYLSLSDRSQVLHR
jgi:site-specific recombinase XerD